jgi:hypothetical protein
MIHRMTRRSREVALVLWSCIVLFAARVIGQFEALVASPAWLPDMDAWYSGLLPYYLLLPVQLALLMAMSIVAWNRRVRTGRFALARPRVAHALRNLALLYFLVMGIRLGVTLAGNGTEYWREGAISVACHWVLALFLLVSARRSIAMDGVRLPAQRRQEYDEADYIPHGDVPSLAQPLAYGFGFREQVGNGDTGRRTEPDHRPAEADGVRERAPVVATLLQREFRQRNVVEHRRHKPKPKSRFR